MKNLFVVIFLICGNAVIAQQDDHCRLKGEQLNVLCSDWENTVKEKKLLALEIRFVITVKNAGELEIIKNWGEKNGYYTEPAAPVKNELAIALKKYPDSFSCNSYYIIYSHIEYALDRLGVGCFSTQGLKMIQLGKPDKT